jgi:uncharacterized membrane protein YfcA
MAGSDGLALVSGVIVGVSLGLTGGGGSIFAVPLLVYLLGLPATTAVGMSLGIVGLTAGVGAVLRLGKGEIDWTAGLVFAGAGMALAPAGAWLSRQLPAAMLLSAFGGLMGVVGWRLWRSGASEVAAPGPCVFRRDGRRGWGCHARLLAAGSVAGVLSGLFGVGGGFIIVPALLYVTGMSVRHAITTSLLTMFLISLSGVASSFLHGAEWPWRTAGPLLIGGVGGIAGGSVLRHRLPARGLQRAFAAGMWLVALFLLARNWPGIAPA